MEFQYRQSFALFLLLKKCGGENLLGRWRRCIFQGEECPNLPSRSLPLHISGISSPGKKALCAPGSAIPAAHGHLITGSRTSFNGSLIIFSLNKGCFSFQFRQFHPSQNAGEKLQNISAFPPRQPQSAQGDTVPAGKVNIICSYYLCCDSSQSPNRSPNAIALRLFTHTERGSLSERVSSPAPSSQTRCSPCHIPPGVPQPLGGSRWNYKPPLHPPEMLLGQGRIGFLRVIAWKGLQPVFTLYSPGTQSVYQEKRSCQVKHYIQRFKLNYGWGRQLCFLLTFPPHLLQGAPALNPCVISSFGVEFCLLLSTDSCPSRGKAPLGKPWGNTSSKKCQSGKLP